MAITYGVLKSGFWGLRSTHELNEGETVTVTRRSGGTNTAKVGHFDSYITARDGQIYYLYAIEGRQSRAGARGRRRYYAQKHQQQQQQQFSDPPPRLCEGCGEVVEAVDGRAPSQDGRWCGRCALDDE